MFNLLRKSIFGLDISDHSIELISLGGPMERPKLLAMGRQILEPGVVEDGKILNKEKLAISLRDLIENPQFGKIKTNKFIFALPESKSFIHIFKAPEVLKKEEIEKEAEFQASQNFPFPLKDLYFDFKIKNKEVLLVAAQKNIVDDYLEVFKRLKLQPIASEIESLSLGRALIENKEQAILIADIGARTTNLSIFDENGLRLSITADIAGNTFTQALVEKLNIPTSEAESLKKEIGLNPEKKEGKAFLILQKEIQEIVSEIKKINEYFQKKEGKTFSKIILAGGSAALPNLAEYLTDNLGKSVLVGDPWEKIDIGILKKKEYFEEALEISPILYATAIGSALRGLLKEPEKAGINLIKNIKT